jgi:hypothetical protein
VSCVLEEGTGLDAKISAGVNREARLCELISHIEAVGSCSPPLATAVYVSKLPRTGRRSSLRTLIKTAVVPADVKGC